MSMDAIPLPRSLKLGFLLCQVVFFLDTTAGMALTTSTKEQTARFTRLQWRCTEHLVCYRPGTACVLVTFQQHHVYIYNICV